VFALQGLWGENDVSRVKRGWWNKTVWETLVYTNQYYHKNKQFRHKTTLLPFNHRAGQWIGSHFFGHKSPL